MHISSLNNYQNLTYKGISKVKYQGLYEKYPQYTKGLLEKLKENSSFTEFAHNKNLKIVFSALDSGYTKIKSSVKIYYENPEQNILKQILRSLFSNSKKIELSMTHDARNEREGLDIATQKLKSVFVSKGQKQDPCYDNVWSGHLDWRIRRIKD